MHQDPPRDAILHLFDWRFADIERELPALAAEGWGAVQVSPPQLSAPHPDWWARYQPLDHTRIEGPLGSEAEFRSMIAAAHRQRPRIAVVVDVVLNHMAERAPGPEPLRYARFGPEHFHPRAAIDWNSIESIRTGWIGWGPDLPDLRTGHPHVRREARAYLEKLLACGADGFRFDAVKHIEPAFFAEVLQGLPVPGPVYGEYIPQPGHGPVMAAYLPQMRLMDFATQRELVRVLRAGGPAAALHHWPRGPEALPAARAVSFATNHDIEHAQYGGFGLPPEVKDMANAWILARPEPPPLVWHEHRHDAAVRAGLVFRAAAQRRGLQAVELGDGIAAWRCANEAVLVLNLSQQAVSLPAFEGAWHDATHGHALPARWHLPPRQPLFAVAPPAYLGFA